MNKPLNLKVSSLKSCFVSPLRILRLADQQNYSAGVCFIGGIYDGSDQAHTDSLLKRAYGLIQAHDKSYIIKRDTAQRIANKAIYGGIISDHYGHFLLESLSRAWYLHNSSGDVYFYRAKRNKEVYSYDNLAVWQRAILEHLITDTSRIKIINEPLMFDELLIPDAGYIIKQFCALKQAHALSLLGSAITANYSKNMAGNKIWLSRSLLTKGAIAGEKNFEIALSNEGFRIVHPETLSLEEQIKLFEYAAVVSGFTGSAFHTLLLAKNKGAKLLHFSRTRHLNINFELCAKAAGFDAEFYNFFMRTGTLKGANSNVLQDFTAIWQLLYSKGLVKTKEYNDITAEEDLKRLDDALKKQRPNLFK